MTTTVRKAHDGAKPLSEFQAVVQQQEGIFGPLQSLSMQPPNNFMTLVVGPSPPPAERALLETYTDHPPAKPSANLICVAECLVNGQSANVAAYRPKPLADAGTGN